MPTADLHHGYVWDCDECGTENFVRAIRAELSPEEDQEMREAFEIEPGDEGEFELMPDTVTCTRCGAVFETMGD